MSDAEPTKPKGRPAAADATPKALQAAQQILLSEGLAKLSIERVAALTGLGKPTLYRRWPNAGALAIAALLDIAPPLPAPRGKSLEAALRAQLRALIAAFNSDWGRLVILTVAAVDPQAEASKGFVKTLLLDPRAQAEAAFEAAIARGEIAAPPDLEVLMDMIFAPIQLRLLLGHRPLYVGLAAALVQTALLACGVDSPRRARPAARAKAPIEPGEKPRQGSLF
jgi:AcrR family transcriptional regulator